MGNLFIIGIGGFLLMVAYEYGWPPVELFDGWLRTERSRNIARVIGWVLTVVVLIVAGRSLWFSVKDLWAGVGLMREHW